MAALGEAIYITGGYEGLSMQPRRAETWRYDPRSDRWERLADMRGVGSREVFGHLMLELWHREYLTPSLADSEAKEAQGIA